MDVLALNDELLNAIAVYRFDDIKDLLKKGADPNSTSPEGTPSLLLTDDKYIVELLVEAGANVDNALEYFVHNDLKDTIILRNLLDGKNSSLFREFRKNLYLSKNVKEAYLQLKELDNEIEKLKNTNNKLSQENNGLTKMLNQIGTATI